MSIIVMMGPFAGVGSVRGAVVDGGLRTDGQDRPGHRQHLTGVPSSASSTGTIRIPARFKPNCRASHRRPYHPRALVSGPAGRIA